MYILLLCCLKGHASCATSRTKNSWTAKSVIHLQIFWIFVSNMRFDTKKWIMQAIYKLEACAIGQAHNFFCLHQSSNIISSWKFIKLLILVDEIKLFRSILAGDLCLWTYNPSIIIFLPLLPLPSVLPTEHDTSSALRSSRGKSEFLSVLVPGVINRSDGYMNLYKYKY